MIRFTSSRRQHESVSPHVVSRDVTVGDAVRLLVLVDLRFSGEIVTMKPTQIVTHTWTVGAKDMSTYVGTEEEMRPLVRAASAYLDTQGGGVVDHRVPTVASPRFATLMQGQVAKVWAVAAATEDATVARKVALYTKGLSTVLDLVAIALDDALPLMEVFDLLQNEDDFLPLGKD